MSSQLDTEFLHGAAFDLFESSSSPVLLFDTDHHLVAANSRGKAVFSIQSEDIASSSDHFQHYEAVESWLSQGGVLDDWSPDGQTVFQPVTQGTSDGKGIILVLRDVSEIRKLARNQNEFIRLLSHDLRTPLTYILGFASMLEQQIPNTLTEKQQQFVSKIMTGIEQITRIVENIQDAGRFDPETGFYEMNRAPVDVGILTHRICEQLVIPTTKTTLQVHTDIDDMLPVIAADSNMLERAITNLIDNAIKYTPDGGRVRVRVYREADDVIVQVKDSGLGIHADDIGKLFQRHVRLHRPEFHKIKGSGLGLFIVKSVAQRHGGRAWVESTLGEGSSFFLSLPLSAR